MTIWLQPGTLAHLGGHSPSQPARSACPSVCRRPSPKGKEDQSMGRLLKLLGLVALVTAVVVVVKQAMARRQGGAAPADGGFDLGGTVSSLRDRATDKAADAVDKAAEAVDKAADAVKEAAKAGADKAGDAADKAAEKAADVAAKAAD